MKSKLEFFSLQVVVNFVITKVLDILIYKFLDKEISKYFDLDFFMYSKELILSLLVLSVTFFLNN
jgi:uncharacterized membrane protein SpoIIM required for sporulation